MNMDAIKKVAASGPVSDVLAGYPGNLLLSAIPGGPAVAPIAYISGLMGNQDNSQKKVGPAFIPGVSNYRIGNRIKTQVVRELEQIKQDKKNEGARPVAHAVAEHLGSGTSMLIPLLAGTGIGAAVGKERGALNGYIAGAGVGTAATLIGAIAAAIKRRRTAQEQIEADKGSLLAKYLVPGRAAYDYYKRIGRSQGERDEAEGKSEKKAFDLNWESVKNKINKGLKMYENASPETRALIGAGAGLGGGALVGKLLGRTSTGAALGAAAGAGAGAYWKDIGKAIKAVKPIAQDAKEKTNAYFQNLWNKYVASNDLDAKKPQVTATAKAQTAAGV